MIVASHIPPTRRPSATSATTMRYRYLATSAQKRADARKKKEKDKRADVAKNVTAPATFSSDFDDECAVYISSLIERFPITLKRTSNMGMGLFASQDIEIGSEVIFESPAFDVTQSLVDQLENSVNGTETDSPLIFGTHSLTVAAMVGETLASTQDPCKPSEYLPIRCLWSIPKTSLSVELAFQLIGDAFQLPSSIWTKEECMLLHNKVATNMIGQELYIASSMFNHNCDSNVAWSPWEPLKQMIAVKPIRKGEQLFVSYCNERDPVKRRTHLFEQFGFHCTCAVCSEADLV